jgi:hypothetical protein
MKRRARLDRLTDDEIATLRAERDERGRTALADYIGISDWTLVRLLSGEPVQPCTATVARQFLASVAA